MNKKISVIGAGKLGLCFALNAEKSGWDVVCVDSNKDYINKVNSRLLNTPEPEVMELLGKSNLTLYSDIQKAVNHTNLHFLFVQTPSLEDGSYDHSRIISVCDQIIERKSSETCYVVICSTVMPGFCKELQSKLAQHNIVVLYNPEFIAQGSIIYDQRNPGLILVGSDVNCEAREVVAQVHESFRDNDAKVYQTSLTTSELTKMGINCFLTLKTSYANTIGDLAYAMGEDPSDLLKIIGSDHRVGPKRFGYGYGYGGPCLPRDNRALSITALKNNISIDIFKSADVANKSHLLKHAQYIIDTLSDDNKNIVIKGVAYKPGTTILEESQQLLTCVILRDLGYNVTIVDQKEILNQINSLYPGMFNLRE
jgi:nucleotide sugar dehydrogenase